MKWFRVKKSIFWHYAGPDRGGPRVYTLCGFFPLRELVSDKQSETPGKASCCPACRERLQASLSL